MSENNNLILPQPSTIPDNHYRDGTTERIVPSQELAEEAVRTLLRYIGEDLDREGLRDTPRRIAKAWKEMTVGYQGPKPEEILSPIFSEECDELVVVRNIHFVSLCEHHGLAYIGSIDIGYIPGINDRQKSLDDQSSPTYRIVGLSKLARLVDHFSKRLTLQERLTRQIAESINNVLKPQGVGVVARAEHSCMSCRGISKSGTQTITSCLLGVFQSDLAARAEFLGMVKE